MELYSNYFTIWSILTLGYKLKAIEYLHRNKQLDNKPGDRNGKNIISNLSIYILYYL